MIKLTIFFACHEKNESRNSVVEGDLNKTPTGLADGRFEFYRMLTIFSF